MTRGSQGAVLACLLLLAGGLALHWPAVNGDIVAYLDSASRGDLTERPTHTGYVALLWLLAIGTVSGANLLSLLGLVLASSAAAFRSPRTSASVLVAVLMLPVAVVGEVDALWIGLVAWSAVAPPAISGCLAAVAVLISPSALMVLPWLVMFRRDAAPVGLLIGLLLAGVQPGYWLGERGLLGASMAPGRTLWNLVTLSALPALTLSRSWLWLAPVALLPPDVPGFALFGVAAVLAMEDKPVVPWAPLLVLVGVQLVGARHAAERHHETLVAHRVAVGDDVFVAAWSDGIRISQAATGTPYGANWLAWPHGVRNQRERVCAAEGPFWLLRGPARVRIPKDSVCARFQP